MNSAKVYCCSVQLLPSAQVIIKRKIASKPDLRFTDYPKHWFEDDALVKSLIIDESDRVYELPETVVPTYCCIFNYEPWVYIDEQLIGWVPHKNHDEVMDILENHSANITVALFGGWYASITEYGTVYRDVADFEAVLQIVY